MFTQVT